MSTGPAARILVILSVIVLASAGGCPSQAPLAPVATNQPASTSNDNPPARPSPVGVSTGDMVEQVVGPAGGVAFSTDGTLLVVFPPGALSADTKIGIQPIASTAPGTEGGGFRLTPDGITFAEPVRLTFKPSAEQLAGAAFPLTGIGYQDKDGVWRWAGEVEHDEANGTLSIFTTHFSDWTFIPGPQIRPGKATVRTGENVTLAIQFCDTQVNEDPELASPNPIYDCDEELAPLNPRFSNCSVNGVPGGNSSIGTATLQGRTITYTAPSVPPSPNTVAVSVEMNQVRLGTRTFDKVLLVSYITITDRRDRYSRTFGFSISYGGHTSTGSADVVWTQFDEDPGFVRRYRATGTVRAELKYLDCKAERFERPVEGLLFVYMDNAVGERKYVFGLNNTLPDPVPFACCQSEDPPCTQELFVYLLVDNGANVGGVCSDGEPRYVRVDQLQAVGCNCSYDVPGARYSGEYNWNFTAD